MDLGTGLALLGGAVGGKELVVKLLGPTADYLGDGLKDYTARRAANVQKIIQVAVAKLGSHLDEAGQIPPRVLKEVIDTGSFCEDQLAVEYYGGVLASSRSGVSRDDRAVPMLDLIKSLSNYQIRVHYVLYQTARRIFRDSGLEILKDAHQFRFYIPISDLIWSMDLQPGEDVETILGHALVGLNNKGLIGQNYSLGRQDFLKTQVPATEVIAEDGGVVTVSALGTEVFLWANGRGNITPNRFIDPSVDLGVLPEVRLPSKAVRVPH